MSVAPTDLLFYAGGDCLDRFGTLVWRRALDQDEPPTFTRTGTARLVSKNGVLRSASANRARVSWPLVDGVRTPALLLEAARTNLVTSDAVTGWVDGNTTTVTDSIADPSGGTGAYTITGDGGSGFEYRARAVTFTGDAVRSAAFVVKEATMPASGNQLLGLYDSTASAFRLRIDITGWSGGEPTLSVVTGTLLGKQALGSGYWVVYGQSTAVTAASTHAVRVYSNVDASAGAITLYRANAFDATVPPSMPLDASGVQNAETFYAPYTHAPQEMTVYVKFVERGTDLITNAGIVHIGGTSSGSDPRLQIHARGGGGYSFRYDDGTVNAAASTTSSIPHGSVVEIVGQLTASGATIYQSVDGATATTATQSASFTFPTAFNDSRIYIGSRGTSERGFADHLSHKVAAGTKTLAEMRAVLP